MASAEIEGQDWLRIHIDSLSDDDLKEHIEQGEHLIERLEATLNDPNISSSQKASNTFLMRSIRKRLEEARAHLNRPRGGDGEAPPPPRPMGRRPR